MHESTQLGHGFGYSRHILTFTISLKAELTKQNPNVLENTCSELSHFLDINMQHITPPSEPNQLPLSGLWQPRLNLKSLYYGEGCVANHLLSILPTTSSRAFIITGQSLNNKTPLVRNLEKLLGEHLAGTISNIRQHGPLEDVEDAIETVLSARKSTATTGNSVEPNTSGSATSSGCVDTIISLGGGSPIDTAKVVSLRFAERHGTFLTHIAIPTTLSAAECTAGGGYTKLDGVKVGFRAPEMGVSTIFYDPLFAQYTPRGLWLSTGLRALDHAIECMYHPAAAEVPWKALALWAVSEFFECLPRVAFSMKHGDDDVADGKTQVEMEHNQVILRLMLAAFASSGLKGENLPGGMGLSHSLGHALGSPYGIPHGVTSCMTLGRVVQLKAQQSELNAMQLARLLPAMGGRRSGSDSQDALEVGERIITLVKDLGIEVKPLSAYGVGKDQAPVITLRALGGKQDDVLYGPVLHLVQSLY
ncbi:maleylacetate reductase protein [Acrodontium crateriforme]|uniref:Maleylacetate reductase protein n=1 Tax=Acrodontium crateriforme TaxID=150365 RepID=A0AAQ3RCG7_9PEZI|nr:maleylacetate reductase protein [Acrodontium crateriforme]